MTYPTTEDGMREQALARRAQRGDIEAFGQLVTIYQQAIFNLAYRFTGDRQEAGDVAQEAFIRAYQKLNLFDARRPFGPWLRRLATNTALNWVKKRRPQVALEDSPPLADPVPGPETQAIAAEAAGRLRAAIASLPPHYRAAIELRHFQELSYQEMSEALGEPLSSVKSWLFRARRKLRETLEHVEHEGR